MGCDFGSIFRLRSGECGARPDIVFCRQRVAVFVDGCFWHSCPQHGTAPKRNTSYWSIKLQRNIDRDREVTSVLTNAGWLVLRIWEHVGPADAADEVESAVLSRRRGSA